MPLSLRCFNRRRRLGRVANFIPYSLVIFHLYALLSFHGAGVDVMADNNVDAASKDASDPSNLEKDSKASSAFTILTDDQQDSLYDPVQADPDCTTSEDATCYEPPISTLDAATIDATCSYGGNDPDNRNKGQCSSSLFVDKHWGSDSSILHMRETLRRSGSGVSQKPNGEEKQQQQPPHEQQSSKRNKRPPIFLLPGLASTRLVAWRFKACPQHPLLSDIKVQDYVWLNINLVLQMSSISIDCFRECLRLGWNQSDTDDVTTGCKLRPDEGLDAISSLSPGGIGSNMLIGGTNTVYAWLIQWLADNLGYDVTNIVGLPYDWRLSPDKLEERDGFLTLTRRRIEAAVESNGKPGIMVAHSMGNLVFRYFLEWMREQLKEEAYARYIRQAKRRAKARRKAAEATSSPSSTLEGITSILPNWMDGVDQWWSSVANSEMKDGKPIQRHEKLWELAQLEGTDMFFEWVEKHIWSYVGLAAPMLGAVNPLRAVISGESMGLPLTDEDARGMEITFGSTHTVNPVSTKAAFCDSWDTERWDEEPTDENSSEKQSDAKLACLDDIFTEVEFGPLLDDNQTLPDGDPWEHYPALRVLLKERRDWDSDFPMVSVTREYCKEKEKAPCAVNETIPFGAKDVQTGNIFTSLNNIFKEKDEPLKIKQEQLKESFWDGKVKHFLNRTWERPIIKHVILAYGVDVSTEVAYEYKKSENLDRNGEKEEHSIPRLTGITTELAAGQLEDERMDTAKGFDLFGKKRKRTNRRQGSLPHSGDGSVPYLSLAWAHTWLLHASRALRYSHSGEGLSSPLDDIKISHRPQGAVEWLQGPPPKREVAPLKEKKIEESSDTGTSHPHGTMYKPEMIRYHNTGTSRTTGIEYTTTVIEAIQVEHKETTRNYDILAAVFTDILEFMHQDMEL
ncbi:hypothetical protein MPSEU_000401400 [Mayamaea pseudoterrestris]|nr:hypothetical protein MPSEU_000401400 [Mayamaea pseudoterrestris]